MQTVDDFEAELRMDVRSLARDMVRLETWAREAYVRHKYLRVGELHTQREQVQALRSGRLRELLAITKGRRIREALRQA